MSSKPNGIMITERPNSVRVRYQRAPKPGDFTSVEAEADNGCRAVVAEAMCRLPLVELKDGERVRVTLLVEVVK